MPPGRQRQVVGMIITRRTDIPTDSPAERQALGLGEEL
jgi:hypothetical protein